MYHRFLIQSSVKGYLGYLHVLCVLISQSCPTLCDPMDCGLPGFSVHGILQARILEWVAIPFSRGTSQPRDRTVVSCIAGRFFTYRATGKSIVQTPASQQCAHKMKATACPSFPSFPLACVCMSPSSQPWGARQSELT